jgi:dipeptidase E
LGIKDTNIVEANINKKIKAKNYKGFDIFYSCGGNTFHILDRVRKTGFDRFIKNFIKSNRLYIGVSAGSIIVHKTIEIAGYGKHGDKNNIKLRDLRGLDVIKTAILPHYKIKLRKDANNFRKKVEYPVMELRDGQALVIYGKKVKKC